MKVIGISCFYHDSAACLTVNGEIIAAAQEERFTRIKHDSSFPNNALKYCLQEGGLQLDDIDYFVYYEKPFRKFVRIIETHLAYAPIGFKSFIHAMRSWATEKLFLKHIIRKNLKLVDLNSPIRRDQILFSSHHLSHAASAFYPSPFSESAILTMDGVGEWATTSIYVGRENKITMLHEIKFPHSLGLLYSAFTSFLGFKVNSGEYKLMGLAPYGNPIYSSFIKEHFVHINEDGSFTLKMEYFSFATTTSMTSKRFHQLFNENPRSPEDPITQKHLDIAASAQCVLDEIVLKIARNIRTKTGQKNLCLAGGVALNCVSNSKILMEKIFENIWIQPAAGDAGGALGASLAAYYYLSDKPRNIRHSPDSMSGAFLGPKFDNETVKKQLDSAGAIYNYFVDDELIKKTAKALANGLAVGWFSGRMEFGPRALGGRSILSDPRDPNMQKNLNLKIKFRESFRPFAPSVLSEDTSSWFELEDISPYMLLVAPVKKSIRIMPDEGLKSGHLLDSINLVRSSIPAVTHVDYSARLQTVEEKINPKYHKLISYFKELTGIPILVNTSFNVRGEPIVCTPADAFKCFMGTELDILVVENYFLEKNQQLIAPSSYHEEIELD